MKLLQIKFKSDKYGTWTFDLENNRCIGGKPLPSEGEAYRFDKEVIPKIEHALTQILSEVFKVQYD